jgi:LysM repeat protein
MGLATSLFVAPAPLLAAGPDKKETSEDKAKRKWVRHEIIPGETLQSIADRYGVHRKSLIRWNKLDPDRPRLYAGKRLKVYAEQTPPERIETTYVVAFGDTWAKIGEAHGVDESDVRRWNLKVPRRFKAGTKLTLWLEPEDLEEEPEWIGSGDGRQREGKSADESDASLPLVAVRSSSLSVGRPSRGRISSSLQLPENPALYTRLRPEEAYASSHMIDTLQVAIGRWRRDSGYAGKLVIAALSKKGGGRLSPHKSHQSGRDADIRMPVKSGVKGSLAKNISDVDWKATWGLVRALLETGEIQYIFLSYDRQKHLYRAAKKAGASKDELEKWIQYPRPNRTNNGVVRHAAGHTSHIHVRVFCGPKESRCEKH